jgi:anthranilate phosphoribosyltransferase
MEKIMRFNPISEVLYRLNVQADIDPLLLELAFDKILADPKLIARDVQLAALLTGIMAKGPKKEEIIALLNSSFKLDHFDPRKRKFIKLPPGNILVGAIGSGKKGFKTMNISTPALLVAASLGAYTAKSVSSSTSSITGSADFLELCGAKLDVPFNQMKKIVVNVGFGAFKIENLLPKFDKIYGNKFFAPHALSFGLAALASPIAYDSFLYGLAHPNVDLCLDVLKHFGVKDVMVASTTQDDIHFLDEMGIYGLTKIRGIQNRTIGSLKCFNPLRELNLPKYGPQDIAEGKTPQQNVKLAVDVLKGRGEKAREDIICINAATLLYLAKKVRNLKEGYILAKDAVSKGKPYNKLLEFIIATGGRPNGDLFK